MGQGLAYIIMGVMNKLFNQLGNEKAVEPIEDYLDSLISRGVLYRWDRQDHGNGWQIYAAAFPNGAWVNWNDKSYPFKEPDKDKE
jgi:hypothetical protein